MSNIPGKIIKEILSGNEKILKKVYKNVYQSMERYALGSNHTVNHAKEAVQDAFEIFYRQALDGNLELSCTVETYVISIARRVLLKDEREWDARLKFAANTEEQIDDTDDVKLKDIQEQKHQLFNNEFKKLNKECQTIITLTIEGKTLREIKEILNYKSEDYVKLKRLRCKHYLIENIKQHPDYEKLRNANPEDFEFPVWRHEQ